MDADRVLETDHRFIHRPGSPDDLDTAEIAFLDGTCGAEQVDLHRSHQLNHAFFTVLEVWRQHQLALSKLVLAWHGNRTQSQDFGQRE